MRRRETESKRERETLSVRLTDRPEGVRVRQKEGHMEIGTEEMAVGKHKEREVEKETGKIIIRHATSNAIPCSTRRRLCGCSPPPALGQQSNENWHP